MKTINKHDIQIPAIIQVSGGKWAYIALIFSLFYFIQTGVNFAALTAFDVLSHVTLYLSFIGLYLWAIRLPESKTIWVLLTALTLLSLGTAITPGTSSLFGYIAFLSSYYFNKKQLWLSVFLTLLAPIGAAWAYNLLTTFYLAPALGISIGMIIYGRFSRAEFINNLIQKQHSQQLEQLATIAERERIARDMHDLLGHSLSSLALKAELAEKLMALGQIDNAQREVSELANIARQSLCEVRHAVTDLKQKGLKAIFANLVSQLESQGFSVQSHVDVTNLPAKIESCVIMLVKEWITNILRHSTGGCVELKLSQDVNSVIFNAQNNDQISIINEGNGVQGMRTRIKELGGDMQLDLQKGVKLHVSLPLNTKEITA